MSVAGPNFAEKRRILQLETLHDLALALRAQRGEQELVDELLQRVCSVLDPAAAVAVTQDPYGGPQAVATVGWQGAPPDGEALLLDPIYRRLLRGEGVLEEHDGTLAGRPFRELLAAPLAHREARFGYLAILDKEARGYGEPSFSEDDRRFLDAVAALAAVSLDGARQVATLEDQRQRLEEENKALRGQLSDELTGQRIVAHAPAMRRILDLVQRVAPRGVNVLVRGESGTGKELVAKLLHVLSGRSGAMVTVNCAAIPEGLLESELFGIEGGVATGVQARVGRFALADGGTLFLDEIGDMPPSLQAKLLRALQEREVVKVGGRRPVPVDVRVVAATHQDLGALIEAGRFRDDLYYRLKGVEMELPPLRQRRRDIPHLVRHFAEDFCKREGIATPSFRSDATALLLSYDYPGNVRELQNIVEGAVSLAEGEIDRPLVESLLTSSAGEAAALEGAPSSVSGSEPGAEGERGLELEAVEHRHILRVLRLTRGNKSAAARILGVDRRTLRRKGF